MQPRLRKLAVDGEGKLAVEVGERRIGEGKFGEGGGVYLRKWGAKGHDSFCALFCIRAPHSVFRQWCTIDCLFGVAICRDVPSSTASVALPRNCN